MSSPLKNKSQTFLILVRTSITGANTELHAYNSAVKKTFTIIHGRPSHCDRDILHKKIEHFIIDVSVPCFIWSGQYGLLAEARNATAYSNLTHLAYTDPWDVEPKMTNPEIMEETLDFRKEKKKAVWNKMRTSRYTR